MMLKCGENKKVAHKAQPSVSQIYLERFYVFCDLLLIRPTATVMESICFIAELAAREASPHNKMGKNKQTNRQICLWGRRLCVCLPIDHK